MSNLSQFFTLGGNKIKSIQRVQAQQGNNGATYSWIAITAAISEVNLNKTIVVYNESAANSVILRIGSGNLGDPVTSINGYSVTGHYAYLVNSTTVGFSGPSVSFLQGTPAYIGAQIIEFE